MLTHILRHIFWMRTYRIPLVVVVGVTLGVFLGHFRINLHQTHTHYSNEGSQHCNWAQFSKSRILSPKNSYLSISASKYVMGRTETNPPPAVILLRNYGSGSIILPPDNAVWLYALPYIYLSCVDSVAELNRTTQKISTTTVVVRFITAFASLFQR